MKKRCLCLSVRLWVRWGRVSVLTHRTGLTVPQGWVLCRGILWQQQSELGAGHGWGMRAEEPCQGSLHWNIQPQCPLEANSQPAAAWEALGQTSHGAGGGDGAPGAPTAHGFCGVGDEDMEPGVSSATALPLSSLCCLHGRKNLWRFRK